MDRTLRDETAVVTGAANGIGRAIAERLADDGAAVVVADVDETGGAETVARIEDAGGEAAFVETDVRDETAVESLFEATAERFGAVDTVVNNAGGSLDDDSPTRLSLDEWRRILDLNLTGTFCCTRAALPYLQRGESGADDDGAGKRGEADTGGRLVHVASVNAVHGIGLAAYSAAKNGILGLSRVVATQYGGHGVRSNVVCPGTIITDASSPKLTDPDAGEIRDEWLDQYPLGRFGDPEEVAEAVCFLGSARSSFVSGTELVVDGGLSAGPDQSLERLMYDVDAL